MKIIAGGRIVEKKGLEDLIEVAAILKQENILAKINLYGEGPLHSKLEKKISELELENITLMGWHPNLKNEFIKHDVFCIPSLLNPLINHWRGYDEWPSSHFN